VFVESLVLFCYPGTPRTKFPSDEQWVALLDAVSMDVELRTGEFVGPMGRERTAQKWVEIAEILNAILGTVKTVAQWKSVSSP